MHSKDYDFWFVSCQIYRPHVQERIVEKVVCWQELSCCSGSSHVKPLYSFVWFRGHLFACICQDSPEGVPIEGNLHLSKRGLG